MEDFNTNVYSRTNTYLIIFPKSYLSKVDAQPVRQCGADLPKADH
jgi:hypothetical protein